MAERQTKQTVTQEATYLIKVKSIFKTEIEDRIVKGEEILKMNFQSKKDFELVKREYSSWNDYNRELLKQSFNDPHNEYFNSYANSVPIVDIYRDEDRLSATKKRKEFRDKLNMKIDNLKKLVQKTELLKPSDSEIAIKENVGVKLNMSKVFIGHGHSQLWARVKLFLQEDFNLEALTFESETRTSESIVNILEGFLDESSFAILIMTAEDETSNGQTRARQNVIHEAGLFQGRLGFDRVVILKQNGTEEFSNIAGLQYISFTGDNIEQCFYELQRKLKKSGMLK